MAVVETNITKKIKQFAAGKVSREALVKYLSVDVKYAPPAPQEPAGSTARFWEARDIPAYEPGTFAEVVLARDSGLLPKDVFDEVHAALLAGAEPK